MPATLAKIVRAKGTQEVRGSALDSAEKSARHEECPLQQQCPGDSHAQICVRTASGGVRRRGIGS
ncbi:MAG: hypothetical protein ACJ79O_18545, partial [Myxococcales bacterium]